MSNGPVGMALYKKYILLLFIINSCKCVIIHKEKNTIFVRIKNKSYKLCIIITYTDTDHIMFILN